MSIELIELLIMESLRDGKFTDEEKDSILSKADVLGVSKNIVLSMIEEKIAEQQEKKKKIEEGIKSDNDKRVNRYDSDVYKILLKLHQEQFKRANKENFYKAICQNKGKMSKDYKLAFIEQIEKSWTRTDNSMGTQMSDGEFEYLDYELTISKEYLIDFIKELEEEYKKNMQLAESNDGFLGKIKNLFKK